MRRRHLPTALVAALAAGLAACTKDDVAEDSIIAAERATLDRWGKGDPRGYLDTYASEVTYSTRCKSAASAESTR